MRSHSSTDTGFIEATKVHSLQVIHFSFSGRITEQNWLSLWFRIPQRATEDSFSGDSGLQPSSRVSCPDDLHKIPALQTGDPTSLHRKADLIALWVETFPSFIKPANYPHIWRRVERKWVCCWNTFNLNKQGRLRIRRKQWKSRMVATCTSGGQLLEMETLEPNSRPNKLRPCVSKTSPDDQYTPGIH